jgi:quinol monooxygenase YgiN
MILIYATIDIKAGRVDEAKAASLEHATAGLTEPGCIGYLFTSDLELADRIHVLERWESEEMFKAHMASERSANFAKHMNDMAQSVSVSRYQVVDDQSDEFRRQSANLMGDSVRT